MWSSALRQELVALCFFLCYLYSGTLLIVSFCFHSVTLLVWQWYCDMYTVARRIPPGPKPWPYFGNLFDVWLRREEEGTLAAFSDFYGPIFTLFLPKPVVFICEPRKFQRLVLNGRPKRANRENSPQLIRKPFALSPHERAHNIQVDKWTCQNPFFTRFFTDGRGPQTDRLQSHADTLVEFMTNELRKTNALPKFQKVDMDITKPLRSTAIAMIVELVLGRDLRFDSGLMSRLEYCSYRKDEELLLELVAEKNVFTDHINLDRPAADNYLKSREFLENQIKEDVEYVRLDVRNNNPPVTFVEMYAMLNFEPLRRHRGQRYRFAELQCEALLPICADILEQTIRPINAIIENSITWMQANEHVQQRMHKENSTRRPDVDYYAREGISRLVREFIRQFSEMEWHNVTVTESELSFDQFTIPKGTTVVNFCPTVREKRKKLVANNAPLPKYRCMCDAIVHRVLVHLYTNLFDHFVILPCRSSTKPDSKVPLCTIKRRLKKKHHTRARHYDDPTPWETDAFQIGDKVRITRQPTILSDVLRPVEITTSEESIAEFEHHAPSLQRTKSSVSALINFMKRGNHSESSTEGEVKPAPKKPQTKSSFLNSLPSFRPAPKPPSLKGSQTSVVAEEIPVPAVEEEELQPVTRGRSATMTARIRGMFANKKKEKIEEKPERRRRRRRPSLPLPPEIIQEDCRGELPPILRIEYTA